MHPRELDEIDRKILMHLQENARYTNVELSERVFLSPPQCYRRIKQLEEDGVIKQSVALLDPKRLGLNLTAFVSISRDTKQHKGMHEIENLLNGLPEVLECYAVTGELDYLVKVVTTNLEGFSEFLREKIMKIPGIVSVRSFICLQEIKSSTALPIESSLVPQRSRRKPRA